MKSRRFLSFSFPLGILLFASLSAQADSLNFDGWSRCNDQPDPAHYDFLVSSKTDALTGKVFPAVQLYSVTDDEKLANHIGFFKGFDATPYAGQTIRFSIQVIADRLTAASSAKLFMGVYRKYRDGEGDVNDRCWFYFDNMDDRPFKTVNQEGTLEIVAKFPPTAERFSIGPMLEGDGSILLFNPVIEIVSPEMKETSPFTKENSPNLVNWCPNE
jgi:hypothetical protein